MDKTRLFSPLSLYEGNIDKPENLNDTIFAAEKLSKDFDFIRIDLYSDGKSCLVGEITNCQAHKALFL